MFYNLLEFPSANPSNRENILKDIIDAYQPDIFMVCELESANAANRILDTSLNSNGTLYNRAQFIDNQSGNADLQQLIFYRSDKFSLEDIEVITTTVRDINRYILKLNTVDADVDPVFLDIYVSHLKSSQGASNENTRLDMVREFTSTLGSLDPNSFVIFAGDLNLYSSDEPAYQELLDTANPITFVDPIDTPGDWHTDESFSEIHTQSTRTSSAPFGAGAGGGLDDRFDFILVSENMMTNPTMRYVPDTYQAYGNNGNCYNESINDSQCNGEFSSALRSDLYNMSDHLPVVMQLETDKEFDLLSGTDFAVDSAVKLERTLVSDILSISISSRLEPVGFMIYNMLGQEVMTVSKTNNSTIKLPISALANGVYYLQSTLPNAQPIKFLKTS